MFTKRLFSLVLGIVFLFQFALAQDADEKAKETEKQQIELIEQIAKDAEALQLAENRAVIAAKLGEGIWRYDEKRARGFFQTAVNELIAAQQQAEANKKQASLLYNLLNGVSPRQEILNIIATRDTEFALDAFYQSRPAKLTAILSNLEEMKKPVSQQFIQTELYYEQSLIARVGEQDPQRALKLIRESLSKGVTYEAISLIDKLKEKDPELAAQFGGEVADKLLATDYDKPNQDLSMATTFVTQFGKKPEEGEKIVKVDERKLRDLTALVARRVLKSEEEYYDFDSLMPIAEKYAPENVAALKRRRAQIENTPDRKEYAAYEKFMESDPSPEKLLAESEKFSESFRSQMYYAAAEKTAMGGNVAQAQKIIATKMSQEETDNYLLQISYGLITKAMSEDKFDEANMLISQLPNENAQLSYLMQLASAIYRKNPAENKKQTLAVLQQARALIPEPADNLEDMSNLMQIGLTVAEIDADQSFQILDSMIQPVNEYVEATVVVSKYRNEGTVRQNELVLNTYGGVAGIYNLSPVLASLKNIDFNHTKSFVGGFQRREMRLSLMLQLIDLTSPNEKTDDSIKVKSVD